MGQKVNPIGLRLGINRTWDSRWYANTGEYGKLLHEDLKIRKYIEQELKQAAISKVVIERPHKKCRVTIHSARPGLIIGKKGADIEKLRRKLTEMTNAETHGGLHRALHGAAEGHATLKLLSDGFGDQLGIELRLADLEDVDDHVRIGQIGDRLAQLLDVGALLADHHARARRIDGHAALLVRALDHDLGNRGLLELLHQFLADGDVLVQQRAVLGLAGIPARIPGPVDAEPQADRVDLLTHE